MAARKKASTKARSSAKKTTTARGKTKAKTTTARSKKTTSSTTRASRTSKTATRAKSTVGSTATGNSKRITSLPTKAITEKMTKAQIYKEISEVTGLNKTDVQNVMVALRNVVERNVKPRAVGKFKIPELDIQVTLKQKEATKARTGRNPFTGEEIQIAAKPARKVIKVTALKSLKELAG